MKDTSTKPNPPPEERRKILGLSRINGFGPAKFKKVLDRTGKLENVHKLGKKELFSIVGNGIGEQIFSKSYLRGIEEYEKELVKREIGYVTVLENEYPKILKEIYDPPTVLYFKGDFCKSDFLKCFSVVGTRNCTRYGEEVTKKVVSGLTEAGFVVVSGMAFGIDKLAHEVALASGGRTIAVLSGRVNEASPRSNEDVYERILKNGCVLSECHLGWDINPGMFPSRNRIVSGISQGTLVVEAGKRSGALITAYQALEQGREVFAIPSCIDNLKGIGTNSLIKNGHAKLVQDVYDILEEFGIKRSDKVNAQRIIYTKEEQQIIDLLLRGGLDVDSLAGEVEYDVSKLSQVLTLMEIDQKVAKDEKGVYFITK